MRSTLKKEGTFLVSPEKLEVNQTLPPSRLDQDDGLYNPRMLTELPVSWKPLSSLISPPPKKTSK